MENSHIHISLFSYLSPKCTNLSPCLLCFVIILESDEMALYVDQKLLNTQSAISPGSTW